MNIEDTDKIGVSYYALREIFSSYEAALSYRPSRLHFLPVKQESTSKPYSYDYPFMNSRLFPQMWTIN